MTRTYAIMEVSKATYDEVAEKLRAAQYDHALHDGLLDMHGIALRPINAPLPGALAKDERG